MLNSICKWVQSEDKNSDIMQAYEEMLDGELDENTLVEILQNVLGDWKEDIFLYGTPTKRVKDYYSFLGI